MKWLKLISAIVLILFVGPSHAQTKGKIAYVANIPNRHFYALFTMDTDGNNRQRLTRSTFVVTTEEIYSISYSPDGTRIAFKSENQIRLINADGSNLLQLTNTSDSNSNPSWSPDGTKIAFSRRIRLATGGWQHDIYVMNADGSDPVNLTNTESRGEDERYPSWSPDGSQIVYSAGPVQGPIDIFLMNADGSNPVQLTDDAGLKRLPRFSPDGSKIVYEQQLDLFDSFAGTDIIVMNADGSNPVNLTSSTDHDFNPSWSPDGSQLIFSSDRTYDGGYPVNLYIMDADGSNVVQLTFGVRDWGQPSAGHQIYLAPIWWSPISIPTIITPASWGQVKWEFR